MPSERQAELAVLEARLLAAQGGSQAAMQLLMSVGESNLSPAGLDLLARLALESGQIEKSRVLWSQALRIDPSFKAASAALAVLDSPWILYGVARSILRLIGVALIIFFVVLGVRSLFVSADANDDKPVLEQSLTE